MPDRVAGCVCVIRVLYGVRHAPTPGELPRLLCTGCTEKVNPLCQVRCLTSFPIRSWIGRGQTPTLRLPPRQNRAPWLFRAGTVQRSLCCKEKTVWPSRVRRGKVHLASHGLARQMAVRWWGAVPLELAVAGASSHRVQRLRAVFEATVLQLCRLWSTAGRRTACGGPAGGGCLPAI